MTRLRTFARSLLSCLALAGASVGASASAHAATTTSATTLVGVMTGASAAAAASSSPGPVITVRRFALVVGANDGGTDRVVLRYAGSDAEAVSAVLERFGGVDPGDLVRLADPTPEQLAEAIDAMSKRVRAARHGGQHVQFVFYYSGHSDEQGLLLGGQRVDYQDLRREVQAVPADVRIAVLDSCASGAFTRTKGGTKRAPFLVSPAAEVKGHAFLTSSSADEAAQESDRVGGSFFTHYFTTGLRGAADADGDRLITLSEAYAFAFDETLARTEATRGGAQHAAYDIQLAGSGDLVMTDLRETSARLELSEAIGGRVAVRTAGGALAAELYKPPGSAAVSLALEPGRYQVTVDDGSVLWRTELAVADGRTAVLERTALVAVSPERTVQRGPATSDSRTSGEYQYIPFDIGLFPPLSINGQDGTGKKIRNAFSLAVVWGRSAQLDGAALSLGASFVDDRMSGAQLSMLGNAAGFGEGVQITTGANHADRFEGLQAGMVNHAKILDPGAQAGLVNVGGKVRGLQLGLVNVGREVDGVQIGLVSVARRADASVSLLSITREGGVHPEVSLSDTAALNLGLRLPATHTYTFAEIGVQPAGPGRGWQAGLGFGGRIRLPQKLFLDLDLASYAVFRGLDRVRSSNPMAKLRLMVGWEPHRHLSVFGGPTLNTLVELDTDQRFARPGLYDWTALDYINPKAKKPDQVAILTREGCGFCTKAKALLKDLGYEYVEVPLAHNGRSTVVGAITGKATVPQVFINGALIGGWEDLERWAKKAA